MSGVSNGGSVPYRVLQIKCLHANCWGARCACGTWLSKHDWDADEARGNAEDVITRTDRWGHSCQYTQNRQLELA